MVFDDEPDERRREKFSRERGGVQDFRRSFDRPKRDYATNGGMKRSYKGGDEDQITKRSRFDGASESYEPTFNRRELESGTGAVTLLTFKKFLATQDESLTDEEAIKKYNDYKTDLLRKECEGYFQAHKEEEWFRFKYHPEESRASREEHCAFITKRLTIFKEFLEAGNFNGISLNSANSEHIIRLMDAVVIKLEDGTDADIEAIKDEPIEDESVQDLGNVSNLAKKDDHSSRIKGIDGGVLLSTKSVSQTEGRSVKTSDEEGSTAMETDPDETVPIDALKSSIVQNQNRRHSEQKGQPFQLHKTCSIHFRTVPANAPLADLENLCKQHPGFLRLAITDPSLDPRGNLIRTAWVTYRRDVNIKEIFWALRGAKLFSSDLGAVVNRDLRRRVRVFSDSFSSTPLSSSSPISALDSHRPVAANALRQAARLIVLLDAREGLYREEVEAEEGEEEGGGSGEGGTASKLTSDLDGVVLQSKNPILSGISDYMVEESSAEEEALLERSAASASCDGTPLEILQQLEEDDKMLQILDCLLLYLRIVHSVDFYGFVQYTQEDQMPNRLGLIHVRALPETSSTNTKQPIKLAKSLVEAHITSFNARLEAGLFKRFTPINEQELKKLGKKDAEKAVEEFVNNNTQQLGPDKWLCPLSGKKFKGPEFVHKHINSKYKEDVDKVRYEAMYFNNYIADPNRPHNPQLFSAVGADPKSSPDRRVSSGGDTLLSPSLTRDRVEFGMTEATERIPYQRNSSWGGSGGFGGGGGGDRFSGSGGPSRYGGGGGRSSYGNAGWRPPPGRLEPMNETAMRGMPMGGGASARDPRAPLSYKDLDAPVEDII